MSTLEAVQKEILEVLDKVDEAQIATILTKIKNDTRIFILGEGRSGLQGKTFAMRLMHLGYTVYVIGETITPSIQEGDLLVSISGSGKTSTVRALTEKAKNQGVQTIGVTSDKTSPLAELTDDVLVVPGATKTGSGVKSIQLLSTLFDQTLHIVLDVICLELSRKENLSNEEAAATHSNME